MTGGTRRAYLAGMIGSASLFSAFLVGVFFHGAVISALPAQPTRLVCSVAFTAGLDLVIGVVGIDADEGARERDRARLALALLPPGRVPWPIGSVRTIGHPQRRRRFSLRSRGIAAAAVTAARSSASIWSSSRRGA